MQRRQFLGGMIAAFAASALYVRRVFALPSAEPSKYAQSKTTDEMSDEEWNRIRDEEEQLTGWMPNKRGFFVEETTADREFGWKSMMSDPKLITPKAKTSGR